MTSELPSALGAFFDAKKAYDTDALIETLAPDAVVTDEGEEHRGADSIRAWNDAAIARFKPVYDVKRVVAGKDGIVVSVEVSGDFPTSPAMLDFHATLRADKIAAMTINVRPKIELPQALEDFLAATARRDSAALLAAFADDAVLTDMGETLRGRAIADWNDKLYIGANVRVDVLTATERNGRTVLRVLVDGDYESFGITEPFELNWYVTIRNGKIAQLDMVEEA
jgi:ketosteroid isomerase-like protein